MSMGMSRKSHQRILTAFMILAVVATLSSIPRSISYAAASSDAEYTTWTEYKDENGLTSFTWNDVTDVVEAVLTLATSSYEKGDSENALSYISSAKNNFWGESGFKIEMQKQLPSASKKTVEADFTAGKF
mgnify:CR=1 FL=1